MVAQARTSIPTQKQVSAGGVAFRQDEGGLQVVIVSIAPHGRWQLPKGLVDAGETPERAAVREVREEAGIETDVLAAITTTDYWYVGTYHGQRTRFHKFVHFFLLAYRGGHIDDHDHEVLEARWVSVEEAIALLAYKNEQEVVRQAERMINV